MQRAWEDTTVLQKHLGNLSAALLQECHSALSALALFFILLVCLLQKSPKYVAHPTRVAWMTVQGGVTRPGPAPMGARREHHPAPPHPQLCSGPTRSHVPVASPAPGSVPSPSAAPLLALPPASAPGHGSIHGPGSRLGSGLGAEPYLGKGPAASLGLGPFTPSASVSPAYPSRGPAPSHGLGGTDKGKVGT